MTELKDLLKRVERRAYGIVLLTGACCNNKEKTQGRLQISRHVKNGGLR